MTRLAFADQNWLNKRADMNNRAIVMTLIISWVEEVVGESEYLFRTLSHFRGDRCVGHTFSESCSLVRLTRW